MVLRLRQHNIGYTADGFYIQLSVEDIVMVTCQCCLLDCSTLYLLLIEIDFQFFRTLVIFFLCVVIADIFLTVKNFCL